MHAQRMWSWHYQMNCTRRERWLPSRVLRVYLRPFSAQFDPKNPLAILSHAEDLRVDEAKQRYMQQWYGSSNIMNERNHHYNRSLQGLEGPNALGVHLSYPARIKCHRCTDLSGSQQLSGFFVEAVESWGP